MKPEKGDGGDREKLRHYAEAISLWRSRFDTAEIAERLAIEESTVAKWVANFRDVVRMNDRLLVDRRRPRGVYTPAQEVPMFLLNGWHILDVPTDIDEVLLSPPACFDKEGLSDG